MLGSHKVVPLLFFYHDLPIRNLTDLFQESEARLFGPVFSSAAVAYQLVCLLAPWPASRLPTDHRLKHYKRKILSAEATISKFLAMMSFPTQRLDVSSS